MNVACTVRFAIFFSIFILLYTFAACTNDNQEIHNVKWCEFDTFVKNPNNHFLLEQLLNIRIDGEDMKYVDKRRHIVNLLYLEYYKVNC